MLTKKLNPKSTAPKKKSTEKKADVKKLSNEELRNLQELSNKFNQAKIALGENTLMQVSILAVVDQIKLEFSIEEKKLTEKYGESAKINLQTGEITEGDGK